MSDSRPLLLDASVLTHYETDLMKRTQDIVLEWIADGCILVTTATSLVVAYSMLGGPEQHRSLTWLLEDPDEPLQVLPLGTASAREVATIQTADRDITLETAHVLHEAGAIGAAVFTFSPKSYVGAGIDVIDMRP